MLDSLPREICFDILTRLPNAVLIRCTTLSREYQSLITSSEFIHAHIRRNTTTNKSQFFLCFAYDSKFNKFVFEPKLDAEPSSGVPSLSQLDENGRVGVEVPISGYRNQWFSVLGSFNGVICLTNDYNTNTHAYILWNPSIRKWLELPASLISFPAHGCVGSGFGFDHLSNDYKVVRLVHLDLENAPSVEVYSMNYGCWRIVGTGPMYKIRGPHGVIWRPCFLDGIVHWLGRGTGPSAGRHAIVTFNLSLEVCGIIDMPECLKFDDVGPLKGFSVIGNENDRTTKDLLECKGMLAVINKVWKTGSCCIWVMKEYGVVASWTKMFQFDFSKDPWWSYGFTNNGEIILPRSLRDSHHHRLINAVVLLEPTTGLEKLVGCINWSVYHIGTYVESMALFDAGQKGLLKKHLSSL